LISPTAFVNVFIVFSTISFFFCSYTGSKFPDKIGVQWLFAEPLTVKCGFLMRRLRRLDPFTAAAFSSPLE
jgi:hypothetical protein